MRLGSLSMTLVLVACLAFALGGCGDDDVDCLTCPGPGPGPTYPESSTPQNVLLALELAYANRDSTQYTGLHDSTYTGSSVDLQDPGNVIDLVFQDEARHIAALAKTPSLTAYLELGSSSTWERIPSDDPSHPEWAIIQIVGSEYRVEITEATNTLGVVGEPGTFLEFAFSPKLDSVSPTDTLWQIVRWRETGNSMPDPTP